LTKLKRENIITYHQACL